jgi:hypothetical protein
MNAKVYTLLDNSLRGSLLLTQWLHIFPRFIIGSMAIKSAHEGYIPWLYPLVHHLSPITNSLLNCVHGIRVNNQHENEAIGSKVDIKVH